MEDHMKFANEWEMKNVNRLSCEFFFLSFFLLVLDIFFLALISGVAAQIRDKNKREAQQDLQQGPRSVAARRLNSHAKSFRLGTRSWRRELAGKRSRAPCPF